MGAVLSVPHARMTRWYDGLDELRQAGFHLLALTPSADAVALDEVVRPERFALVLGSEGEGLSTRWLSAADMRVRIPMRAGIDSLNVAAAAAVAFYVLGPTSHRALEARNRVDLWSRTIAREMIVTDVSGRSW